LLIEAVVDATARAIEAHYQLDPATQTERHAEAQTLAKCLSYACSNFYFGSGAFPESNMPNTSTIKTAAGKERFIRDTEAILRRIGDVPVAHTTYELVQLLDYLLPGNPAFCFGLFSRITTSGRRQGFQLESLGVDIMVHLVGQCLADHEYIFRDDNLRRSLVECLDVFIGAGWPAAIRLAYRVPDALR
jgi:hypothetical protein